MCLVGDEATTATMVAVLCEGDKTNREAEERELLEQRDARKNEIREEKKKRLGQNSGEMKNESEFDETKKSSEKPKTPVFVEDDDFVDKNDEFINLDDDLVDVEDKNEENEENEVENDNDNVEGEDEDDNVEDANMLYGKSIITESSQNKRRREVLPKSECKVMMYINYQKKKRLWEVTSLELVHNHCLISPSKMSLVQRERHINTATRSLTKMLYDSGVRNCQVMNVIGNIYGGNDKVGFNVQHIRNVLRDERKKRFEISDAQVGLDLLHRLNEESGSKYFIRTEVDEENHLKCLVWIDPRCLMAYQNFSDVVAFDTTYRTNRYTMPFVPFTGVNHHYQSVIFGFALMRDEHASTFE
ncbi:hypothetical protein AgCh_003716 [Apium graveolens]